MLVLLSGIAQTGSVSAGVAFVDAGQLLLFMTVSLVVGILIVPRVLDYVARAKSDEMLLVTVLGFCFGFCLLVVKLDYSIALGAFLIGAIMAESRSLHRIERVIAPVRDMFSAIFFVTIGLLLNPTVLIDYAWPIAVITFAVVVGKIVSCGLGTFLAGKDGRTSMRVGMSVAQIGEFSFIIASLGLSLKVTSGFLYPIAVAVSALTTLFTPYLIRAADPITLRIARSMPAPVANTFGLYSQWLASIRPESGAPTIFSMTRRIVLQIAVNLALVAAIFLGASYSAPYATEYLSRWLQTNDAQRVVLWSAALVVSMPFLVAVYRKLESLALLLAEVSVQPAKAGTLHERDPLDDFRPDSDRRDVRRVPAGGGALGRDPAAVRPDDRRAALRGAVAHGIVALVREDPRDDADRVARDLRGAARPLVILSDARFIRFRQ